MAGTLQVLLLAGVILVALPGFNCRSPREFRDQDSEESDIDVNIDDEKKVAVFTSDAEGVFILQDYQKGLVITRDSGSGICNVAVLHQSKSDGLTLEKDLVKKGPADSLVLRRYDIQSVSELIEDTAFIPAEAHLYCTEGYRWVTTAPAARNTISVKTGKAAKCSWCETVDEVADTVDKVGKAVDTAKEIGGAVKDVVDWASSW